jgi:hypothetical protein
MKLPVKKRNVTHYLLDILSIGKPRQKKQIILK